MVKKLKNNLFEHKVSKEIQSARDILSNKSKIYYSNEALNPRSKRGRPTKKSIEIPEEKERARSVGLIRPNKSKKKK